MNMAKLSEPPGEYTGVSLLQKNAGPVWNIYKTNWNKKVQVFLNIPRRVMLSRQLVSISGSFQTAAMDGVAP